MENLNYFTQPIISPLSSMGSLYDPYSMDAIINSSVQNRASMLQPKLRELYRQREAEKQTLQTGIGTKSQQALQLQREEDKLERKTVSREKREAEKQRRFELKQQKRRAKHRGK